MGFDLNRKFGVELEVRLQDQDEFAEDVVSCLERETQLPMVNAVDDYYSQDDPDDVRWHAKLDSSIRGRGFELGSPPLKGKRGLEELRHMMKHLAEYCEADSSTGAHVHHECRDLGQEEVISLYRVYYSFQPVIAFLVAPSRRYNGYCTPLETCVEGFGPQTEKIYTGLCYDRRALNVGSIQYRKTIEFRQHQGTVNADKMIAWIMYTQGLIQYAKRVGKPKEDRELDLRRMFSRMGWSGKELEDGQVAWARAYLEARFQEFARHPYRVPLKMGRQLEEVVHA